ncbi:tRNA nuclease WapA [Anaerolineae bacterium]|nr:tRNA nuclease WapA [Anaerolineae bacterium]
MNLLRRITLLLVISLLFQPALPAVASSAIKLNRPTRAVVLTDASGAAAEDTPSIVGAEIPFASWARTPESGSVLPVIYKTGDAKSVLISTARTDAPSNVSSTQIITNARDIMYLVNSKQIARTRNFFDPSPYWASLISPTSPISGTTIYDFILDPQVPYYKAWIAGDTGIWRTTNLNDTWPEWQQVRSMYAITSSFPFGKSAPDTVVVSRIAGDVSKPGYYLVVLGSNTVQYKDAWIGYTFDYGNSWSWVPLPKLGDWNLGTRYVSNTTGLALSQDGTGRVWAGAWQFSSMALSRILFSEDYGRTWRIVYQPTPGPSDFYPTSLYFSRGVLFATMGISVGKSLDNGKTWQFLSGALGTKTNLNYGINGSIVTSKLVYYTAGTSDWALNGTLQYSTDGGASFSTRSTSPFTNTGTTSAVYSWYDNPDRLAWSATARAGGVTSVLYYSDNRGQSWQDKTGDWNTVFANQWANGDVFIASPYQSAYLRDESRRDPSRRGKKEQQDCALNCTPPVHFANDPVDTSNGNLTYQTTDLSVASLGGNLAFQRSYASLDSSVPRPLGYGWANNFDAQVIAPITTAHPVTVALQTASGSQLQFFHIGGGAYAPDLGVTAALTRTVVGSVVTYTLVDKLQTTYTFNLTGTLLTKRSSLGYLTTYSYTVPNTLTQVTDVGTGRWLKFTYDPQSRMKTVFDNGGRTITFTYNLTGDLTSLADVRGLTWTYVYTGSHLLWKVIDPDLRTVVRTEYDAQGRAVAQYDGLDKRTVKLDFGLGGVTTLTDARNFTSTDIYLGGTWIGGMDATSRPITRSYDLNFNPVYLADQNGNATQMLWSADGANLERTINASGYTATMQYDRYNHLTVITNTRGFATSFVYSGPLLLRETDALGYTTVYTYGSFVGLNNLLLAQQDPLGYVTRYQYDSLGQRTAITDALGYVTRFGYDTVGRLITTTDALGRITVNTYDNTDRLMAVTDNYTNTTVEQNYRNAYNLITRYGYDGFGHQSAVTDTQNHVTRHYFDPAGRLISTTVNFTLSANADPAQYNLKTWYGYDAAGNQIAITDTLGRVTRTEYDSLNRPVTVTENFKDGTFNPLVPGEDVKWITRYDPAGNIVEEIDPATGAGSGSITRYWYDRLKRVISTTTNYTPTPGADPNTYNLTTWYQYDPAGNPVAITDTLRRVTRQEFDALNRLRAVTNALTGTVRYDYDALGRQTIITDASGVAVYLTYDARGLPIETRNGLNQRTRYSYDAVGIRTVMTDANGIVTCYEYDPLSRLNVVTENFTTTLGLDPTRYNVATRYAYDPLGNRTVITNARGYTTTYTYDALSRVIRETNPLSLTTRQQYDALGNRVVMTDGKQQVTRYGYDGLNRLLVITYTADATTVKFAYDTLGNRTAMTDTTGTTTYVYDALNRPITITSPLTGVVGYRYDALSNRTRLIYPNGKIITTTFDLLNRPQQITDWSGGVTRYAYDRAGRPLTITLPNSLTTLYRYDNAGRLISLTHARQSWALATYTYTLDAVGNRLAVWERLSALTKLAYLPLILNNATGGGGQMLSVPPDSGGQPFASPLSTPPAGAQPFTSPLTTPPATSSSSVPSQLPDLSLLVLTPTVLAAVAARKKGRKWALPLAMLAGTIMIAGLTQSSGAMPAPRPFLSPQTPPTQPGCVYPTAADGARVINYTYDPLYRLNAAAYSTGECYQYAYDKVGNRTTQTATIISTVVTTYAYDAADRLTNVGGQAYTWDNNGSLTNNGKFTFTYNNAGRMTRAQGITATQVYTYNGDGLLMNRNGARYVWDQATDLPQMLSDGSTVYIPGVGQWNGTSWVYELTDGLGSVRQLADAQGNIIQRYDYSPFGEVVAIEGQRPSKVQYTGEQNDSDTGLVYLRARWYDAVTGRFTTIDPFSGFDSLPQTQHSYAYVGNNPINLTDPSGEIAPLLALAGYAAGYFAYDYFDRNHRGWFSDAVGALMGYENIQQDAWKLSDPCQSTTCKILALGDMALNGVMGTALVGGLSKVVKFHAMAQELVQTGTSGLRLGHITLKQVVTDLTKQGLFRIPGTRTILAPLGKLSTGGLAHEIAHVMQEFGTSGLAQRIIQALQRFSVWSTRGAGWQQVLKSPLYVLNPVELHAAAAGLGGLRNIELLVGNRGLLWLRHMNQAIPQIMDLSWLKWLTLDANCEQSK